MALAVKLCTGAWQSQQGKMLVVLLQPLPPLPVPSLLRQLLSSTRSHRSHRYFSVHGSTNKPQRSLSRQDSNSYYAAVIYKV